jgi:hypothetical protein
MDKTEFETICADLAERVAREAAQGLGKKWRCPPDLREEIVAYALTCRSRGEALGAISARLGLVESTLARWFRKRKKRAPIDSGHDPGFRSVAIVPCNQLQRSSSLHHLRLITADGHIIEGLDLESTAYLLKVIG